MDSEDEAVHSEEGPRAVLCPGEDSWVEADLAEEIVEDLVETVEALVRLEEVASRGAAWEVIAVASGEQHRSQATYQNLLTCDLVGHLVETEAMAVRDPLEASGESSDV